MQYWENTESSKALRCAFKQCTCFLFVILFLISHFFSYAKAIEPRYKINGNQGDGIITFDHFVQQNLHQYIQEVETTIEKGKNMQSIMMSLKMKELGDMTVQAVLNSADKKKLQKKIGIYSFILLFTL